MASAVHHRDGDHAEGEPSGRYRKERHRDLLSVEATAGLGSRTADVGINEPGTLIGYCKSVFHGKLLFTK